MNLILKRLSIALTVAGVLTIYGCGGGDDDGRVPTASLVGTVAVGAALPNAKMTLKDIHGRTLTTVADANGAYKFFDVSSLTAPLMLQASGTAGGVLYTLHSMLMTVPDVGSSGVLNVTPATEAVVAQAMGSDPTAAFEDNALIKAIDAKKLSDAKKKLIAALTSVLTALKQDPTTVDLFATAFAADNTGLDKLFDTIQFQHAADGVGKQTITVTDKSTETVTWITTEAKEADVRKIVAPTEAALALDTAAINKFLSTFNALSSTEAGIKSDAMKALFDADFQNNGRDQSAQLAHMANEAVGVKMLDYVLQGCDGETRVCNGDITLQSPDKTTTRFNMPVKLGSNGRWLAYGNRSPFDYGFKPVVSATYGVDNGSTTLLGSVQTGLNFWFKSVVGQNQSRTYSSAKLLVSDNGMDWTFVAKFKPNNFCQNSDYLPIDDGIRSLSCRNFLAISDDAALATNSARAVGTRKYKIIAFSTADYTGTETSYVVRLQQDLFTQTTGGAALASSSLEITAAELGSNSVSFAGNPDALSIWASTPYLMSNGVPALDYITSGSGSILSTLHTTNCESCHTVKPFTWEGGSVLALGGKATVAAANTRCLEYGRTTAQCDDDYGWNAEINNIFLSTNDSQGRGIWKSYSLGTGYNTRTFRR